MTRTRSRAATADRSIIQADSLQASAMPWSLRDPTGNNELLAIDAQGNMYTAGQDINNLAMTALTNTGTMSAAVLVGGIIEGTPTSAATYTTDTGAALDGALANPNVGDTFTSVVVNTSGGANAITIAGGTGVTLKGSTTTIGQNKTGLLTFRRTGVGAWTCYLTVSS